MGTVTKYQWKQFCFVVAGWSGRWYYQLADALPRGPVLGPYKTKKAAIAAAILACSVS